MSGASPGRLFPAGHLTLAALARTPASTPPSTTPAPPTSAARPSSATSHPAEVLLRVWLNGGTDAQDVTQRHALEDLAAAGMVTRATSSTSSTTVTYSLRMLPEPSPATAAHSALQLT
ncbi:hypothetical protein QWJ26_27385 [Streptomyces sp. CSDS2]|uniref:hypothetical protein n=1 Tax=Streptomyces sp. CSDS2 TaxID=3055051 RepID=UPI0025B24323|nr:hypothetical protein [Streptomyces sp. CSDS2]MDN3263469.1 hypothetical protein [Streptomyces sp. CSDS2]